MAMLKLSPPWNIYVAEVEALFKFDKQVHVVYDQEERKLSLYVDDGRKADALDKLIPHEVEFGNIVMHVEVIPANAYTGNLSVSKDTLFKLAFDGNEAFSRAIAVRNAYMTNDLTYVVFVKKVVQIWTDNLGDLYGLHSTLYQDIAKDVFGDCDGVFFCTEPNEPMLKDSLDSPLGEWP